VIALRSDLKVVLAAQPVDFRKSLHTLSALVSEALRPNPCPMQSACLKGANKRHPIVKAQKGRPLRQGGSEIARTVIAMRSISINLRPPHAVQVGRKPNRPESRWPA
jgi:hypothetical protein